MNNYFEGWYFKHQNGDKTLSLIPGRANDETFIQVITQDKSYHVRYPLSAYKKHDIVSVGNSTFSLDGIAIDINSDKLTLKGQISYKGIIPIQSDIMGPFRFLPMQCRHGVHSMRHRLFGTLTLNGGQLDFSGGKGYIESDKGRSFPKSYTWIQCNDLEGDTSVMVSIAHIPFAGTWFWGCIGVVWFKGKEYRLATYKGVRVRHRSKTYIELTQGPYRLKINISPHKGHNLLAPKKGMMSQVIRESASIKAQFQFEKDSKVLFKEASDHASFEHVE